MIIYLGSDHRGFKLKETIKEYLTLSGYTVRDLGNDHYELDDDYPDFASRVAEKVVTDPTGSRGILFCGSGVGVSIVANKYQGIRSALVFSPDQAYASRNDDDTNVLSLAADCLEPEQAKKIVSVWLQTPFSKEEKNKRRIKKISDIEQKSL